ncbi:hypothetical protein P7C70_g559, partial [Phenoliferia sp. Uapishka_3]
MLFSTLFTSFALTSAFTSVLAAPFAPAPESDLQERSSESAIQERSLYTSVDILADLGNLLDLYVSAKVNLDNGHPVWGDLDGITALLNAKVILLNNNVNVNAKVLLADNDALDVRVKLYSWYTSHQQYIQYWSTYVRLSSYLLVCSRVDKFGKQWSQHKSDVTVNVYLGNWHTSLLNLNIAIKSYEGALSHYIPPSQYYNCYSIFAGLFSVLGGAINIIASINLGLLNVLAHIGINL